MDSPNQVAPVDIEEGQRNNDGNKRGWRRVLFIILICARIGVAIDVFVGAVSTRLSGVYWLLLGVSEIVEFLYYQFRKVGNGPRGEKNGLNEAIFISLIVSIVLFAVLGVMNFHLNLLWLLIWIIIGNLGETIFTFLHKVDGKVNKVLGVSRVFYTLANSFFVLTAELMYDLGLTLVFYIILGILYLIHGILLWPGLSRYRDLLQET